MNGDIDLRTIVLLALASVTSYVAWQNPAAGAAILVGVGVIALLGSWVKP